MCFRNTNRVVTHALLDVEVYSLLWLLGLNVALFCLLVLSTSYVELRLLAEDRAKLIGRELLRDPNR